MIRHTEVSSMVVFSTPEVSEIGILSQNYSVARQPILHLNHNLPVILMILIVHNVFPHSLQMALLWCLLVHRAPKDVNIKYKNYLAITSVFCYDFEIFYDKENNHFK